MALDQEEDREAERGEGISAMDSEEREGVS